ncbi:MAG: hypothetical protein OEZ25_08950 [Candidatus Bathyarchaeota archaeon]|nr:hypothetical protein [Candidatus Bathyarchaeota archaeon]
MDRKLIFTLSMFGLAMAFATVFWIPSNIEPFFWLIIFLLCAYFIAKQKKDKRFLHGFFVSLLNSVWITSAHIILYEKYIANHEAEAEMLINGPMPDSPKLMMLITGVGIGIISGLILGLFAFIASKIVKKKEKNNG